MLIKTKAVFLTPSDSDLKSWEISFFVRVSIGNVSASPDRECSSHSDKVIVMNLYRYNMPLRKILIFANL